MLIELPFFNSNKGAPAGPVLTDERAQLVGQSGGQYFHQTKQRKLFTAPLPAAGVVLPIFSNTTQQFGLMNPMGSAKLLTLVELALTYVSTTGAAGGFVLGVAKDIGSGSAGTAAPIVSSTEIAAFGGRTNGRASDVNKGKVLSPFVLLAAPVIYKHLGMNQLVITAADATNTQWQAVRRFDGEVQIEPGTIMPISGNIATLITMSGSLTWAEEDI